MEKPLKKPLKLKHLKELLQISKELKMSLGMRQEPSPSRFQFLKLAAQRNRTSESQAESNFLLSRMIVRSKATAKLFLTSFCHVLSFFFLFEAYVLRPWGMASTEASAVRGMARPCRMPRRQGAGRQEFGSSKLFIE